MTGENGKTDDTDDTKKRFSIRQYGKNLRGVGHEIVADRTARDVLAVAGVLGAAGGLAVAYGNATDAVDFQNIETAQKAGNEQALKTAKEHGVELDARTLEAILDARNDAIAKAVASQESNRDAVMGANFHPVKPVAAGAIGVPLLLTLAVALPGSWVKKQREAERAAGTQGQGRG